MEKFKKILSLALALSMTAVLFTGCGGGNEAGTSEGGAEAKDTLTVAIQADPRTVDPHAASDSSSVNNLNPVYETLVRYDENGNIAPLLATEWKQLDELKYEFKLRDDVYFHNGEKMTANDVLFSFKRASGPEGMKVSYIMGAIDADNCEVVDDTTIIVATKMPFPLIGYLPYIGAVVVSEKEFTENPEKAASNPVGTGPFKFVSWAKNDKCVYERNDNYWGEKPKYKNLVIRTIAEANSRVIELESGTVDIALAIPAKSVASLEDNPETKILKKDSTSIDYVVFNMKKKPLDDPKVRLAIDYAIDEKAIVDAVYLGTANYSPSTVVPSMMYFDDSDMDCRYDPEKAKALLKEAGVSDLHLQMIIAENKTRMDISVIMQQMLSEVGITMEIQSFESGTVSDMVDAGEHELTISGWGAVGFPEPDNNIFGPFHTKFIPVDNKSFYSDPKMDEMLEEQRRLPDGPEREAKIKEIQKYLREVNPVLPIGNAQQIVGVRSNVEGFAPTPAASHFYHSAYFA